MSAFIRDSNSGTNLQHHDNCDHMTNHMSSSYLKKKQTKQTKTMHNKVLLGYNETLDYKPGHYLNGKLLIRALVTPTKGQSRTTGRKGTDSMPVEFSSLTSKHTPRIKL